jgi:hypothetical protein
MKRRHKSSALSHPSITPQSLSDINALTPSYRAEELGMYLIRLIVIFHSHCDLHLFVQARKAATEARVVRTADIPTHISIA